MALITEGIDWYKRLSSAVAPNTYRWTIGMRAQWLGLRSCGNLVTRYGEGSWYKPYGWSEIELNPEGSTNTYALKLNSEDVTGGALTFGAHLTVQQDP